MVFDSMHPMNKEISKMKMNMTRSTTLAVFSALALLVGCASKVPLDNKPADVETRTPAVPTTPSNPGDSASTGGAGAGSVAKVDLTQQQTSTAVPVSERIVYFDYDSYVVKDEYRGIVESHAKQLTGDRSKKLVVEGHTDERGGSEYNLALGQKRAESVAKALVLLGATEAQIESVSFGKERPAVQGADEATWAKNRRAELKTR
jgi:peptidoglycan-associated lipoprotein